MCMFFHTYLLAIRNCTSPVRAAPHLSLFKRLTDVKCTKQQTQTRIDARAAEDGRALIDGCVCVCVCGDAHTIVEQFRVPERNAPRSRIHYLDTPNSPASSGWSAHRMAIHRSAAADSCSCVRVSGRSATGRDNDTPSTDPSHSSRRPLCDKKDE